jgi:hypothetical protein
VNKEIKLEKEEKSAYGYDVLISTGEFQAKAHITSSRNLTRHMEIDKLK